MIPNSIIIFKSTLNLEKGNKDLQIPATVNPEIVKQISPKTRHVQLTTNSSIILIETDVIGHK